MHTGESKHTRNLYINLACLSVCQGVSIQKKRQNGWTDRDQFAVTKPPEKTFKYKNPRERRKKYYLKRNSKKLIPLIEKEAQADNYELFKRILLH